jgi:hypothetical protein
MVVVPFLPLLPMQTVKVDVIPPHKFVRLFVQLMLTALPIPIA